VDEHFPFVLFYITAADINFYIGLSLSRFHFIMCQFEESAIKILFFYPMVAWWYGDYLFIFLQNDGYSIIH